jgi:hypothetical protein
MRRAADFAAVAALLATACSALPSPAVTAPADAVARRFAALSSPLDEPDLHSPEPAADSAPRPLTDFEKLHALAGHHARRWLLGLPITGPGDDDAVGGLGVSAMDPEVARFAAYVGTLGPGVYATYMFIGAGYMFILCCCTFGCCLCCTMALLPTELCVCGIC